MQNGIVLIDEIENGFYYKSLRNIWKAIINAAIKFNVQLFVTTHNYEALQELLHSIEEESLESIKDHIKAYTIFKDKNDNNKVTEYNYNQFRNAIENENEIR
jgi:AAA15 family ATPase/GTPase